MDEQQPQCPVCATLRDERDEARRDVEGATLAPDGGDPG